MIIEINGQEHEAYRLIMKKENALEILNGKKRAEIRTFSDVYISMFFDKKIREQQEKDQAEGKEIDIEDAIKQTQYARFTNYSGSWFLDVKLSELGLCTLDEETVAELNADFDLHDLDNEWQQYRDLPDEDKPIFFLLGIKEVVSHNGLT